MDKSESFSEEPHQILILGTGELGLAIVEAFARHRQQQAGRSSQQFRVTVYRSGSSKHVGIDERLVKLGASPVHVNIFDQTEAELADHFTGFDTIVVCSGFGSALGIQSKLAKAFVASDAKTYIPWQYGMDYDAVGRGSGMELFDEQLAVRDILRDKIGDACEDGTLSFAATNSTQRRWVIISTGMFSSFIVLPEFGVITDPSGKGQDYLVRTLNTKDTKVTLSCVEDIAKCVVHVVLVDPKLLGVVFVAGDTLSYGEVANALETATQKPVATEVWPMDQLKKELEQREDAGKGWQAQMEKYRLVFGRGVGASWPMEKTLNHKVGIETTNFTEWLKEKWLPAKLQSTE